MHFRCGPEGDNQRLVLSGAGEISAGTLPLLSDGKGRYPDPRHPQAQADGQQGSERLA